MKLNFYPKAKTKFDENFENYRIRRPKIRLQPSWFTDKAKHCLQFDLVLFFFREEDNAERCRYRDVIPGEPTRVKLQPDNDDQHDFINANYVTGYDNQEKFYIFTQGDTEELYSQQEMFKNFCSSFKDHWGAPLEISGE